MEKGIPSNFKKIIQEAVNVALQSGRLQARRGIGEPFKNTEKRLYALPVLREKVQSDRKYLLQLQDEGAPQRSMSIVRYSKSGMRLTPDEIISAQIQDTCAAIAEDEHEISVIETALDAIRDDPYYFCVAGRYFEGLTDEEISRRIPCDATTAWRNRKRLVERLSVRLYGRDALL